MNKWVLTVKDDLIDEIRQTIGYLYWPVPRSSATLISQRNSDSFCGSSQLSYNVFFDFLSPIFFEYDQLQ
jgi:hypothetical protein